MSLFQQIFGLGGEPAGSDHDVVPGPDDIVVSIEGGGNGITSPATGYELSLVRSPPSSQRSSSFHPSPPGDDAGEGPVNESLPQEEADNETTEREEALATQVRGCHEELEQAQNRAEEMQIRARVLEVERNAAQDDLEEMQNRELMCPICARMYDDVENRNRCIDRHRRQLNRCRQRRGRRPYPISPDRGRSRGLGGHSPAPTSQGTSVSTGIRQTPQEQSSEDELAGPTTVASSSASTGRSQGSGRRRGQSESSDGLVPSMTPPGRRRRRVDHVRASTSSDGLVSSRTPPGRRRRHLHAVVIPTAAAPSPLPPAAPANARRVTRAMLKANQGTLAAGLQ